jgi:hypothetical protein
MNLIRQLASEIYRMFAGDWKMSVFTVILVFAAIAIHFLTLLPSLWVGIGLMMGCLMLLVMRVLIYARNAATQRR